MNNTTNKSILGILIFGLSIFFLVQCDNAQQKPDVTEEEPTPSSCYDRYASYEGNVPPKSEYDGPLYYLGQKWPKTNKNRQNSLILRYFALFLAQKSAWRVRTPRTHLQLP